MIDEEIQVSYTKPNASPERASRRITSTRAQSQDTPEAQTAERPSRIQPSLRSSNRSRLGLMENFWGAELAEVEPTSDTTGRRTSRGDEPGDTYDDEDYDKFFTESVFNPKLEAVTGDASVCRRIQVGLYPEDAELLEEIFAQSKAAGLKGVSRARILRVALRHFHTCWLNAD